MFVLDIHHLLGATHDGGGVGGNEILAVADTDDHGAAFTGGDDLIRVTFLNDGDGVGTNHMVEGDTDGLEEVYVLALLDVLDEVGKHLGVSRRLKGEATFLQLFAQAEVVLDDAVVDQRDLA